MGVDILADPVALLLSGNLVITEMDPAINTRVRNVIGDRP